MDKEVIFREHIDGKYGPELRLLLDDIKNIIKPDDERGIIIVVEFLNGEMVTIHYDDKNIRNEQFCKAIELFLPIFAYRQNKGEENMNKLGYVAQLNGVVIPFNRITSFRLYILEPSQYEILVYTDDKDIPTRVIYQDCKDLCSDFERVTKEYNLYKSFELKEMNGLEEDKFVRICSSRIRLNSIDRYFASYDFDYDGSGTGKQKKRHFVVINDARHYCDSEKEANDYVKMLDELLGVNDENSNSKAQ
jgi:hypothetical protein